MFNENVLKVLTQFNSMCKSAILRYPETVLVSEGGDTLVKIPMQDLGAEAFEEIPLNNSLGDLLSLIKLFPEDRTIQINQNAINISSAETSSVFIMDNVALMEAYDKDLTQFEKTESVPAVAEYELTHETIKSVQSATSVFKDLTEIIFTSKDSEMTVSLGATNKFNAKSNKYSVTKPAVTSKEFEIKIPVENFNVLPLSDYIFKVYYNSARDSYRILMVNKNIPGIKILMVVKF